VEGARVAIVNRRADTAARVVDEIVDAGGEAQAFPADVADVRAVRNAVAAIAARWGRIDILVNNAGVMIGQPIEAITEADWQYQIDVNLKGVLFLTQAVVPIFKKNGGGKIINIGSIFGHDGYPAASVYCATKGALELLTKSLCLELREHRINVNCLGPGFIATPLNESFRDDPKFNRVAAGRFGAPNLWMQPDELTGTAVYLASSDSESVNGVTLYVDRGWSAY
jgi:NAD(P)-dependent dehydrogenase (short-subunit alcohol dehydrogenase family)